MKKLLTVIVVALAFVSFTNAATNKCNDGIPIPLSVMGHDDDDVQNGLPKSPETSLTVYLDNYTLYFADAFSEVVAIELKDASGAVVYSTNLPVGSQTLVLPATLSGTYTLFIYVGGLCYYGYIIL